MPTCSDRQLLQSQRELGFSTRIGVAKQLRPFSGKPTAEALADYINREIYPVLKPTRDKLNEVYLPVAEMAPSANPLHYFFSENTANADPTTGFLRLNQAVQNTATVIRVSELNTRAISAAAWLDVMQGSATVPLGVVTLTDAADPGRFIRFDLGSMTDNGAYWDLNVTVIESSHPNPFVQGESVSIGFIAGVAAGTIAAAPGVPGIRAISAGTQSASSGTIIFANSNGFSFGFSGSSQITASFAALKTLSLVTYPTTISSNFSLNTNSSFSGDPIVFQLAGTDGSLYRRANVFWRLSSGSMVGIAPVQVEAGPGLLSAQHISFSVGSGLTWGVTSTLDAIFGRIVQVTGSANDKSLAVASHIGGNVVSSMSQLAFSNASGLTFSLSTAANAATLLGSVNDQSVAVVSHVGGNVVSSATRLAFSNASGLTFSLSTAASGATLLGSVNDQSIAVLSHVGGNAVSSATRLAFSNASGLTFSLSTAASGATLLGSVNDQSLGIVSHVGGNVVSSVTRLAFSNASNVTFSLSTAAGAATLFASVNAGGGGIQGIAASGSTVTDGTVVFSNGTAVTAGAASASVNNVVFDISGSSVRATAMMRITANITTTGGFQVSKLNFVNSNGITFGVATSNDAEGRGVQVTASYSPLIASGLVVAGPGSFSNGSFVISSGTSPFPVQANLSNSTFLLDYPEPVGGFSNGARINNSTIMAYRSVHNSPFFFQPFPDGAPLVGFDTNFKFGNWRMLMSGNFGSTNSSTNAGGGGSFAYTLKLGLYSVVNTTGSQLTLVASNSLVASTNASGSGVSNFGAGLRRIDFGTANWNTAGPLTRGQYWLGFMVSMQTSNDDRAALLVETVNPAAFNGAFGQGSATTSRLYPFAGFYTTTTNAFPNSLASSHLFTNSNASLANIFPWVSVQPVMNAAFG